MKVTASSNIGGKWIDKKTLLSGTKAKIKTEATEQPSQQGGTQLVAKLLVQGQMEPQNVAINKPSKNALISAYGDDTNDWIDKVLTIHTETAIVSGKRGVALYLIPEGFELKEDAGGYLVIQKIGETPKPLTTIDYPEEDIDPESIPF